MSSAPSQPVPSHVPPELIWNNDIDSFSSKFDNPYVGACDAIHEGPDIVWAAKGAYNGRPGWLLTRYQHISDVHFDTDHFTAAANRDATALLGFDVPLLPAEADPPDHRHYRQLIQPRFQPSVINGLTPMIEDICDELIAGFKEPDGCEFVGEFSSLLPSYVFLALMGLPREELRKFFEWERDFLRGDTMEIRVAAMRSIYDYFMECLAGRRANPRDDLASLIANGTVGDRAIAENEAIGMSITLFIGGLDSVSSGLGWYMRHLALDPELQDRLRLNPELLPAAVDELSRAYGTNSNSRIVREDTLFHGVPMRKGDVVAMPTFFASRDAREFEDPHKIDLDRKHRSLTFGTAHHNCIGIHLAKREIRIVLSKFLSRYRNIRIAPGREPVWTTQTIWGVKGLPLVWNQP